MNGAPSGASLKLGLQADVATIKKCFSKWHWRVESQQNVPYTTVRPPLHLLLMCISSVQIRLLSSHTPSCSSWRHQQRTVFCEIEWALCFNLTLERRIVSVLPPSVTAKTDAQQLQVILVPITSYHPQSHTVVWTAGWLFFLLLPPPSCAHFYFHPQNCCMLWPGVMMARGKRDPAFSDSLLYYPGCSYLKGGGVFPLQGSVCWRRRAAWWIWRQRAVAQLSYTERDQGPGLLWILLGNIYTFLFHVI